VTVLHSELHDNVSIAAMLPVLTYTNTTGRNLAVLSKIRVGSLTQPIAGNGFYQLNVTIDGSEVLPNAAVSVQTQDDVTLQSRHVSIEVGQQIIIRVQGQPADLNIDVESVLVDVTPARVSDLVGSGSTPVDHNYGSIDNLRVVDPLGAGIQDVTISAYLEADYDAGNYGPGFLKGRTTTGVDGRWRNPIALDPASYVLVLSKPGVLETEAVTFTVL
jgi:hypothetical protein